MNVQSQADWSFRRIVLVFITVRLALQVVGLLSLFYFPPASAIGPARDFRYSSPRPATVEIWSRWDSEWYLLIADHGYDSYDYFQKFGGGKYLKQDIVKFFPGYPLLIRLFDFVIGNSAVSGFLISNLAALLFLFYLYRLANILFEEQSAFRACIFAVVFPTSFFLSAVYSESFFLAAMTAAFYYLEDRRLLPACIAAAVASTTRVQGVLALPALLWLAWVRFPEQKWKAASLLGVSLVVPILLFFWYVQNLFGSFSWILESQRYWRGEMHYPLYAFVRFFHSNIAIHGQHNSLIDFSVATLSILALLLSLRRLPGAYNLYAAIVILFPLCSSLFSFSRLVLADFPLMILLGRYLQRTGTALQFAFALLLAFFFAAFANWYWVG